MKPDKWLQPHCAVEMGSLFPLTTSSGGPRADHGRKQVAGGEIETGGLTRSGPLRKGLLTARATLVAEVAKLHKRLLEIARADGVCRRLMTVPGVGALTALTFKTA